MCQNFHFDYPHTSLNSIPSPDAQDTAFPGQQIWQRKNEGSLWHHQLRSQNAEPLTHQTANRHTELCLVFDDVKM